MTTVARAPVLRAAAVAAAMAAGLGLSACGGDASDTGVATAPPPFALASDMPLSLIHI